MRMLNSVAPSLVALPIARGTFASNAEMHYLLMEYYDMEDVMPNTADFCKKIAALHKDSMMKSPNGKFGFHVTTCDGSLPQIVSYNVSWEDFFMCNMRDTANRYSEINGFEKEFHARVEALCEKVIPRLLRPLETGGRDLRPCLVHGDLWEGNVAINLATKEPIIFDAASLWAHNEYEFRFVKPHRYRINEAFSTEYHKHFPVSEPQEDADDRNALYSILTDLHAACAYKAGYEYKELAMITMKRLIEKFPNGYEGTELKKGETISPGAIKHNERGSCMKRIFASNISAVQCADGGSNPLSISVKKSDNF